jgi:hypothetical protein
VCRSMGGAMEGVVVVVGGVRLFAKNGPEAAT